jgi:hypothetical protein
MDKTRVGGEPVAKDKKRPGALPLQVFYHVIARITVSGPSERLLRAAACNPPGYFALVTPAEPWRLGCEYYFYSTFETKCS